VIKRSALGLALAVIVVCSALFATARPALAQPAATSSGNIYLEQRVTALPAAALLTRDPRQLLDPRRQQVAKDRAFMRRMLFLLGLLLPALALVYLWQSGRSAMLRDAIMRRASNRIAARFVFGAAIATVAALAVLPAELWSYRLAVAYEMTPQPTVVWLRDALVLWVIAACSIGLLTAFVYTLVERTRLWYVYAAIGLFGFTLVGSVIEPVVVAPVFGAMRPVGASLAATLDRLGAGAHAGTVVFLVDNAPRRAIATGRIEGIGPTERIVFSDTLIASATTGEIAFVAARELGHRERGDVLRLAVAWTIALILCVAVAVAVADRIRFRRDDDSLSRLPLVGALSAVVALAILPAYNAYSRTIEANADLYALGLTADRASAVRELVRVGDESLSPLCPSRFTRLYLLSHPSIGSQIALALGRPDPCP
jgi:STE24 endopeptidase